MRFRSASGRRGRRPGSPRALGRRLAHGGRNSHIATLVERHSRFVVLVRLASKDTTTVVTALTTAVRTLPAGLMTSLTWDRGRELAAHKRFTVDTHVQVYFCDPQSPWQRGTNENTNGLLRQYFPKGRTCRATVRHIWTKWRSSSTPGLAKRWATRRQRLDWRILLRRPVEPADDTTVAGGSSSCGEGLGSGVGAEGVIHPPDVDVWQ